MIDPAAPAPRIELVIRLLHGRSGGAERVYTELAGALAASGHDVVCHYCDSSAGEPFYRFDRRVLVENLYDREARQRARFRLVDALGRSVPAALGGALPRWAARNGFFLSRLVEAWTAAPPDLVLSFLPPANTPALLAGARRGVPVVPTNHGAPHSDYDSGDRWDPNPVDRALRRWALRFATRIHVQFPSHIQDFPAKLRPRIMAIPNPLPRAFDQPPEGLPRAPRVLAVGRLIPLKNHALLLEAWARVAPEVPGWQLRIVGTGPERERLLELARRLELPRFELCGERTDIEQEYSTAEIFAHPSHTEGFALACAEALRCGLPVVALSGCPGLSEFVADEQNGLLVPPGGGAVALAAALRRLIDDAALRARLRAAAPASVERFSADVIGARWVRFVGELVGPTGDGRSSARGPKEETESRTSHVGSG